jgi:glucose/arabinose dehydrogenase
MPSLCSFAHRRFAFPLAASLFCVVAPILLASCYAVRPTQAGGEARSGERGYAPEDIALPEGYRIEAVATGLTFPTAAVFDDTGGLYVVEGGYAYGDAWQIPRLLKVMGPNMFFSVASSPDSNGPWTGAVYVPGEGGKGRGAFYIAEGGHRKGGRILRVGANGSLEPLVENLPSFGDHHTNGPLLGPDGMIYFGQGTATNSGVVGPDNAEFGWLKAHPEVHDVPCQDIALTGMNYRSENALGGGGQVETGAFSSFGTMAGDGKIIPGEIPCNGAIMRVARQGGKPELVAWGFRNPFALAYAPDGRLFAIDNGYDERGSRPIWGAGELLWEVHQGRWYGWPDYSGDKSVDHAEFTPPHGERPRLLLRKPPGPWLATQAATTPGATATSQGATGPASTGLTGAGMAGTGMTAPEATPELPPVPVAILPVHASADGIDFSTSDAFGYQGHAFVAEFGDMAPGAGKVLEPVGFKIARVDLARGVSEDFAINRKGPGPASRLKAKGLERPVSLRFSPDGKSLYVVDFGVLAEDGKGPHPRERTGAVWRIWKEGGK